MFAIKIYLGNPTRFAPRPNPAPCLAVTPTLGLTASNRANTAAASTASVATSSIGRDFRGMNTAAAAITSPSIRYLTTRLTISKMVLSSIFTIIYTQKKLTLIKLFKGKYIQIRICLPKQIHPP